MDGETIRLHSLVCAGFNADFDGDSVAVHLPISEQAQQEARDLMMTRVNLLKPASGELLVTPSQDTVLGCFYLTVKPVEPKPQRPDRLPRRTQEEVLYLQDCGVLKVHDWVRLAPNHGNAPPITTVGRVLFNELLAGENAMILKRALLGVPEQYRPVVEEFYCKRRLKSETGSRM